jgi:uridine phosphorylase
MCYASGNLGIGKVLEDIPVNPRPVSAEDTPHLTPATLVGRRFGRDAFKGITVALVGYCPRPRKLDRYQPHNTSDQYFIHVCPASVQICSHDGTEFLSIAHVYGGPVSSALIEELAYYGIEYVLAYGLAGGLRTQHLAMGDLYLVERALVWDGTTPHYTDDKLIPSDEFLNAKIRALAEETGFPALTPVQALTGDAIYREYDQDLERARESGCDIVNCDSSHLFAVSREVGIKSTECGVISDVAQSDGDEWQSTLSVMLSSSDTKTHDPLFLVGGIVEFYAEVLMPEIVRG